MRKKILLLILCTLFCCSACGTSTEQEDVMQSEKAGSTLEMYEKDGKMVIRNSKYHYQISLSNEYRYIVSTMPEERRNGEKYDIFFTEREYPNLSAHIDKDLYEENREKWIETFLALDFYEG